MTPLPIEGLTVDQLREALAYRLSGAATHRGHAQDLDADADRIREAINTREAQP